MDMLFEDKIVSDRNTIWYSDGHLSSEQSKYLIELLNDLKPKYCLEIGFAGGRHTSTLLHSCTPEKVISIDIDFDYHDGRGYIDKFKQKFNNIEFIESDSNSIITNKFMKKNFPNGLDYIFIDGDHSYTGCLNDIRNCWNYLNPNGIMIVDDYNSGPPIGTYISDVNNAVNYFISSNNTNNEAIKLSDGKGMIKLTKIVS